MRKITDVKYIRELASKLSPELSDIIWHDSEVTFSTWGQGLETGKAIEFLSICALINAFQKEGGRVTIPDLYNNYPDLYYTRNIIPRQYGAQAGHDAANNVFLPLNLRFQGAFTPRAVITKTDNSSLLIFREGHPIHFINYAKKHNIYYLERPDLVVAQGEINLDLLSDDEIAFNYSCGLGTSSGIMRVVNHSKLPLISLNNIGELEIPISGIVECSVSKGKDRAVEQLFAYNNLFQFPMKPISILVNGKNRKCPEYDVQATLDLLTTDPVQLEFSIMEGMKHFVREIVAR